MIKDKIKRSVLAGAIALGSVIGLEAIGGYCSKAVGSVLSNIDSLHGNIGQYCQYKLDHDRVKARLRKQKQEEKEDGFLAVFPDPECIERWPLTPTNEVKIKASDGRTIIQRHPTRIHTNIDKVPEHVKDAFVWREDRQFYSHDGINWRAKPRGLWRYVTKGSFGGTGITEQVAKLAFANRGELVKRNGAGGIKRKLEELVYSTELDHRFSKDEILGFYLNNIPIGNGNFGIASAALDYFGKDAKDLSLQEALFLAVVPKNPGRNPRNGGIEFQIAQYSAFVNSLHNDELIDDKQFEDCVNYIPRLKSDIRKNGNKRDGKTRVTYESAVKAVRGELLDLGIDLYDYLQAERRGRTNQRFENPGFGFTINTSLDHKLTQKLKDAVKSRFRFKPKKANIASAVLDSTGRIVAIIGRTNYKTWADMNLAVQGRYPMASTVKPFYYALAYELGLFDSRDEFYDDKDSFELDRAGNKISIPEVISPPRNHDRGYGRLWTLERALANSNNIVSRRVYDAILREPNGWQKILHYFDLLGFDIDEYKKAGQNERNSNVLGARHAGVVDVAAAYNVFANNGSYFEPRIIDGLKIGEEVIERKSEGVIVFRDPRTIESVRRSLKRVANNQIGNGFEGFIGMKTGTSSETKFAWTAGILEHEDQKYSYAFVALNERGRSLGKDLYAADIVLPTVKSFVRRVVPRARIPEELVASLEDKTADETFLDMCRPYSDVSATMNKISGYHSARDESGLTLVRNILDSCANEASMGSRDWTYYKFASGDASQRLYELSKQEYGEDSDVAQNHLRNAMDSYKLVATQSPENYGPVAEGRYNDLRKSLVVGKHD